jgi:hypothetical protein
MAEDTNALDRLSEAGNEAIDLINRVDTATGKFQPGKRQGSIIKAAQKNIFEFPVFISNSVPLDFATATVSLLEQNYAAYLQMAISINPVVDAKTVKNGLQFAQYKVNTNKYLEYTEPGFQHDVCHNVIQEGKYVFEFDLLSIEDSEARLINEAVDYQPLSEFSHFFQEDSNQDLSNMTNDAINTLNNRQSRTEIFVPNLDMNAIFKDGNDDIMQEIEIAKGDGDIPKLDANIDLLRGYMTSTNGSTDMVPWSVFKTSIERSFNDKSKSDDFLQSFENIIKDNNLNNFYHIAFVGTYDTDRDFNTLSKTFYNLATTENQLASADKTLLKNALDEYGANGAITSQQSQGLIDRLFGTTDIETRNTVAKTLYSAEHIKDISDYASSGVAYNNLPNGIKNIFSGNEKDYESIKDDFANRRTHQANQIKIDDQNMASNDQNLLLNAVKLNIPFGSLPDPQKRLLGVTAKKTDGNYNDQILAANTLYDKLTNSYNASNDRARQDMLYNKLLRGAELGAAELKELGISENDAKELKSQATKHITYDANRDQYTQAQTASTKFNYAMNKLNNGIELSPAEQNDLGIKDPEDYERLKTQAQALRDKDLAQSQILQRQAQKANSKFYRGAEALQTGLNIANTAASTVNAATNAAYNISTFRDRKAAQKLANQNMELQQEKLKQDLADHDELMRMKKNEMYGKMKTSNIQYVDDSKCNKMNTMKPLLMKVTLSMLNKDDSIQPIEYVIGVKTHNRVIPASILPEVAKYPLKEMDKISRKIKWRAGELKFLKDLVFRINEKKQTAADARDPNRKWYRRLYELAHMKGDAPATAVVQGKSIFAAFIRDKQGKSKLMHGFIPNAAIVMSQADVNNIKQQTEIDLLKGSSAKKFCGELFLMNLVVIDTDAGSIKIMQPDEANDYSVHSLASVNKQLATLDTAGTKTRDMFKLLG